MKNKEKLNIGLFIDTFYPMIDGVITVVDNYAKRLAKKANVIVFAPAPRKPFDDSSLPYKVVRCKKMNLPFLDYDLPVPNLDKNFKKQIDTANLDIIHIHSPFSIGKMGANYGKKHNIPIIATMHSQFKQDFKKAVKVGFIANILLAKIMKVFNTTTECWAVNREIANVFKSYGYKREPLVCNNGTDFNLIENKVESDRLVNEKYNLKSDDVVFLFVGRINVLKNILFTVDALRLVKDKGFNFKMLFVGTGAHEQQLRDKIHSLKLDNDVILCGKVSDRNFMRSIYARAHLFLFPSLYDASSLVQIEAASQKTPTIFLKGAATADTVTNDVNGFIVENNIESFANKIIETLEKKDYYTKISEGAYRDLYVSWDKTVENVYDKYLKLIGEHGGRK